MSLVYYRPQDPVNVRAYWSARFILRFGIGRDFRSYIPMAYTMFWCAFVVRVVAAIVFKSTEPTKLSLPLAQMTRPALLAVTAGSALIGILLFVLFTLGRLENLSRSILLMDWGMMLAFSTVNRLMMKTGNLYRRRVAPAAADAA